MPEEWPGKSLTDHLLSTEDGLVNPLRETVFMGKERHDLGREGDTGYPVRCIRTQDYLYVRNFKPDRWPAGNPETWYSVVDSSPTKKAILHQHAEGKNHYYNLAFAKHEEEELFNITDDPECLVNLASHEGYFELKESLWHHLKSFLEKTKDPRILGQGEVFDTYEYVGNSDHSWQHYLNGDWHVQDY